MKKVNYFNECKTIDEAKNVFKKLCFELHPDHNESETAHHDFIKMREQYENFRPSEGRERTKNDKADSIYNIVKQFETLDNVLVSFVGSFIWLEDEPHFFGSTKSQKNSIKKIILEGYNSPRFAFKRKKWYFSPIGYKQKSKSSKSFEQLKDKWGSKTYKPQEKEKIS
jgi:hypothetical protein